MSFTKRFTFICDMCGLFCRPYDEETQFGCKDEDNPEPLDPSHYCKRCSPKLYKLWLEHFKSGRRNGCWQKSKGEQRAAKKCGLVWIHSEGIGEYGTPDFIMYCYVSKDDPRLKETDNAKRLIAEAEQLMKELEK